MFAGICIGAVVGASIVALFVVAIDRPPDQIPVRVYTPRPDHDEAER